ncbi:MAG TPA: ribosome silencing factor [Gammaproteobacteria bacterium]|nr:ribosome silencing factor [Gammaproteobacteria bacterium]
MQTEQLRKLVLDALEELKGVDILDLDVRDQTTVTDVMVIASGTSDRHVRSLADNVVVNCKKAGQPPLGVEGEREGEWVLVDLGDVVVHVMQPRIREFYALEKLWAVTEEKRGRSAGPDAG